MDTQKAKEDLKEINKRLTKLDEITERLIKLGILEVSKV